MVARAQHGLQAQGGGAQHLVALGVALRVVDILEAVQVDEQQRQHVLRDGRARQRPGQEVLQPVAVGQARQAIFIGQAAQVALVLLGRADVLQCHGQAVAAAHEAAAYPAQLERIAVRQLDLFLGKARLHGGPVVMDEIAEIRFVGARLQAHAQQLLAAHAEIAGARLVTIDDLEVGDDAITAAQGRNDVKTVARALGGHAVGVAHAFGLVVAPGQAQRQHGGDDSKGQQQQGHCQGDARIDGARFLVGMQHFAVGQAHDGRKRVGFQRLPAHVAVLLVGKSEAAARLHGAAVRFQEARVEEGRAAMRARHGQHARAQAHAEELALLAHHGGHAELAKIDAVVEFGKIAGMNGNE